MANLRERRTADTLFFAQYDQFTSICSDGYVPHPASDFWDTSWYLFAIKDAQGRLRFMPGHF
ncbi:hypothetical protein, partial [Vibrio cholerae]|uniref:hypothetical protein n=1 Tax=Vibrio cholerae TaxID=666 RepID=UPI00372CF224